MLGAHGHCWSPGDSLPSPLGKCGGFGLREDGAARRCGCPSAAGSCAGLRLGRWDLGQCLPWGLFGQVLQPNSTCVNSHFESVHPGDVHFDFFLFKSQPFCISLFPFSQGRKQGLLFFVPVFYFPPLSTLFLQQQRNLSSGWGACSRLLTPALRGWQMEPEVWSILGLSCGGIPEHGHWLLPCSRSVSRHPGS